MEISDEGAKEDIQNLKKESRTSVTFDTDSHAMLGCLAAFWDERDHTFSHLQNGQEFSNPANLEENYYSGVA